MSPSRWMFAHQLTISCRTRSSCSYMARQMAVFGSQLWFEWLTWGGSCRSPTRPIPVIGRTVAYFQSGHRRTASSTTRLGWVADSLLMGWLSRKQTSYHRHRGPQVSVAGSYSCVQTGLSFESTCHTNASPVRLARRHGVSPTSSGHRHSKRFARVIQPLLLRRLPCERHGLLSPARPTHPRQSLPKV